MLSSSLSGALPKAAFIGEPHNIARVYNAGRFERVAALTQLYPDILTIQNFSASVPHFQDVEFLFSTWGMPALSASQIALLPNLKAVFYAAGTVQNFARPFLENGVQVFSGWGANAVPVAQWSLAQILLANKGFHRNTREFTATRRSEGAFSGRGNFGATVSILGAGQIGRLVCKYLRPFGLDVAVFDPFLDADAIQSLGARKLESLEAAFVEGAVVSNHLANLPATVGMLRGEHFESLPPCATFINTGRGATVREDEMIAVLKQRLDVMAILDVTHPEPPSSDSLLWELPNVVLTSHIAGSIGDELVRMADYMIEDFQALLAGTPTRWGVTLEMLETMA